ncbi:hypothetical protein DPMN_047234 [Dreissena polymorpha]|uniref:Uncharacterized protein n=1 Tax=Dreissena polymorpha TaxID=45954 RepID=A0A9D4I1A8_DREPO|nr:hypothetical protein DPMN_047234 [Dreissena polymorpha]
MDMVSALRPGVTGSIPSLTLWIWCPPCDQEVTGSIHSVTLWIWCPPCDQKVTGSIPSVTLWIWCPPSDQKVTGLIPSVTLWIWCPPCDQEVMGSTDRETDRPTCTKQYTPSSSKGGIKVRINAFRCYCLLGWKGIHSADWRYVSQSCIVCSEVINH